MKCSGQDSFARHSQMHYRFRLKGNRDLNGEGERADFAFPVTCSDSPPSSSPSETKGKPGTAGSKSALKCL